MRILPKNPYLQNIINHYYQQGNRFIGTDDYLEYLKTFGFAVPILQESLEFPDDFDDYEMMSFIMRWS